MRRTLVQPVRRNRPGNGVVVTGGRPQTLLACCCRSSPRRRRGCRPHAWSDTAMPTPLPNPIKIMVKGASTVGWLEHDGRSAQRLRLPAGAGGVAAAGRPARRVCARFRSPPSGRRPRCTLGARVDRLLAGRRRARVRALRDDPPVPAVVARAAREQPRVPPRRGPAVPRAIPAPAVDVARQGAGALDTRLDPTIRRGRPQKVAADLEKIIGHTQELHSRW